MTRRYHSTSDVLATLKKVLVFKPAAAPADILDQAVEVLYKGRGYFWIGIYLVAGDKVTRQCFRGPAPSCHGFALGVGNVGTAGQTGVTKLVPDVSADSTYSMCFAETRSEIVLPVKIAARVLGVIHVESDRLNGISRQERVLLEQVAKLLARYLTTDQGKLLLRKAREKSRATQTAVQPHNRPQSAGLGASRAAAGEHSTR